MALEVDAGGRGMKKKSRHYKHSKCGFFFLAGAQQVIYETRAIVGTQQA